MSLKQSLELHTSRLAALRKRLAFYLANGREGTSVVESVRQQIADAKSGSVYARVEAYMRSPESDARMMELLG